jgi:hypothetical protein
MKQNKCRFCDTHSETLKHLFYECLYIREFRENIKEWIYSKINVIIPLDVVSIFLAYRNIISFTMVIFINRPEYILAFQYFR